MKYFRYKNNLYLFILTDLVLLSSLGKKTSLFQNVFTLKSSYSILLSAFIFLGVVVELQSSSTERVSRKGLGKCSGALTTVEGWNGSNAESIKLFMAADWSRRPREMAAVFPPPQPAPAGRFNTLWQKTIADFAAVNRECSHHRQHLLSRLNISISNSCLNQRKNM